MEQPKIIQPYNLEWEPHPLVTGIESAYLISNRDENVDLTCMLVHVPSGTHVEKHSHECDEIIYVLKGKAMMSIDGIGEVSMTAGTFLRIPKGVTHRPYKIEDSLIVYDVFYPFLR